MPHKIRVTNKNAICLVVDRLHAGFLGAMGNSWARTPTFDRLASQSLLFDAAVIDSPHLSSLYHSYWQGQHALTTSSIDPHDTNNSLPSRLDAAGVRSVLLTDDPSVAESKVAACFSERIVLPGATPTTLADSMEETGLAHFFAAAIDLVERMDEPSLIWLHTRGMAAPWDAPLELREAFADEEDPDPLTSVDTPCQILPPDYDPDELLGITQAYVAQIALWDACLGTLLDAIDESPAADRTLLNVLGARGFPLGEHLGVGAASDALYGELLNVPWAMRLPKAEAASIRTSELVQPPDLFATLCDWWQFDASAESSPGNQQRESLLKLAATEGTWPRDRACCRGEDDEWAIRTRAWFARGTSPTEIADPEMAIPEIDNAQLFTKPDDRFEVNEVSARCVDITSLMAAAHAEFRQLSAAGSAEPVKTLSALDDRLTDGRA